MTRHDLIAASETTAAQILDMPVAKFRDLVSVGALPPPIKLADGVKRWRVADLHAIMRGDAARPKEALEL